MVDYLSLTPGEEQVRQDGFSAFNALQEEYDALEAELIDAEARIEELEQPGLLRRLWRKIW